jgi:1-acyl-sn-glycerol-3-phosphate acyltransferase
MAKRELWRIPPLGWLLERLGAFQVTRGEPDRESIRQARELLDRGLVVGIFPEGHRIRESGLGEFLPGVGMLALKAGVPVIPIRIHGNELVGQRLFLSRPRIRLVVGKPVDLEVQGMSRGRAFREATDRIHQAMEAL